MTFYDLILKRRTIRRFKEKKIPYQILERCVNAARLAPSVANLQPCEYLIIDGEDLLDQVFPTLGWAGYISDGTPPPAEAPTAYIIVLINKEIKAPKYRYDVGFGVENMLLTALEEGIGSCCFASIDRDRLRKNLNIPQKYVIDLVVALGYPNEAPVEEKLKESVKYWKDEHGVLHVPKRELKSILHRNIIASH